MLAPIDSQSSPAGKAWESPVVTAYGGQPIPQIILIGPDGKTIAKDLRGQAIEQAVAKALEREQDWAVR